MDNLDIRPIGIRQCFPQAMQSAETLKYPGGNSVEITSPAVCTFIGSANEASGPMKPCVYCSLCNTKNQHGELFSLHTIIIIIYSTTSVPRSVQRTQHTVAQVPAPKSLPYNIIKHVQGRAGVVLGVVGVPLTSIHSFLPTWKVYLGLNCVESIYEK